MSARMLMPFTMTTGGRALSLLPSTAAATPFSSKVHMSRLSLTNPNSASIVSGSMEKIRSLAAAFQGFAVTMDKETRSTLNKRYMQTTIANMKIDALLNGKSIVSNMGS
ncbi:Uncharacterized protein Fot_35707 [Forsythia ovata]|uniref:Uncharacterized protein n=1 Tax=Forsythia ovata TaxID=205694 RepID=A0ABD1SMB8_9LAMI